MKLVPALPGFCGGAILLISIEEDYYAMRRAGNRRWVLR
jgi:hypothetical protein